MYLYLGEELRKKYIKDLTDTYNFYFDRIKPIFSNAGKEAEKYTKKLWNNAMNTPMTEEEYEMFDPASSAEDVLEAGIERFELLSLMRYRTLGMWISLMCQVWEQQLFTFVIDEIRWTFEYNTKDSQKCFDFCKKVFNQFGIRFENLSNWKKILELNLLVNVLKHGEGNSSKKLRELRPDYFNPDGFRDRLELYNTSLLEETLAIKDKDFTDYYEVLKDFWSQLPEYMYWNESENING